MAVNIISRGEADQARTLQAYKDMRTEVLFENRFGRQIWTRLYDAKKFVKRDEGHIVPGTERELRDQHWARRNRAQANAEAQATEATSETQVNTEAGDELSLEEASARYKEQEGKNVPSNKKNDLNWIVSKLTS
jgi:hypothetical protein